MNGGDKLITNDGLKEVIQAIRYNEDFEGGIGFYLQSPDGNKFKLCVDNDGTIYTILIEKSTGELNGGD